jgi:RNA polymerase sigma factor (sigma-70 family)
VEQNQRLAEQFEGERPRLRSVAYRILGSSNEADDAVQEAWLRLSRSEPGEIENLAGWLTTVVARVCLSMLRSRKVLREEPLEPEVAGREERRPEDEALLADSVGLALQVVLDTLSPDERVAFVLHDMFGLPFAEIAVMVRRTPAAARKLASRARRRVKDSAVPGVRDTTRRREVVNAFFAAARSGDFDALVMVLDPNAVLLVDADVPNQALHGLAPALRAVELQPVLVQGVTGMIAARRGRPIAVMSFTVADGKITKIDAVTDPERVQAAVTAAVID